MQMKLYFFLTAGFCLIYYFTLCFYSRKWNSTFALFWPAMGTVHLIPGVLPLPDGIVRVLVALIIILWVVFLFVEVLICKAMFSSSPDNVPYLIVLGAQVRGTRITNSLKRRLDASLVYLEKNPGTKVIVSGGQGKGEDISEAEAMAVYLRQNGIREERIIREDESTSTWENMKFSGRIIGDLDCQAAVATNNFHLYRALQIGKQVGFQNLSGIAASSNPIFQINYLVREFFAVMKLSLIKITRAVNGQK